MKFVCNSIPIEVYYDTLGPNLLREDFGLISHEQGLNVFVSLQPNHHVGT